MHFEFRFSKGSDIQICLYRSVNSKRVARIKDAPSGSIISIDDLDTTSHHYSIRLGECFAIENLGGDVLAGRVIEIMDDSLGADHDNVKFKYSAFRAGERVTAP
jgi:hypothetical protein